MQGLRATSESGYNPRMRVLAAFALLAVAACGSGNGSGGGSTSQCSGIVDPICQKAVACSAGGDSGVVFVIGASDAGVGSYDFTLNSASGNDESGCENLVGGGCTGSHAAQFTAACGSAISSGLQCGPEREPPRNGAHGSRCVRAESLVTARSSGARGQKIAGDTASTNQAAGRRARSEP